MLSHIAVRSAAARLSSSQVMWDVTCSFPWSLLVISSARAGGDRFGVVMAKGVQWCLPRGKGWRKES